MGAVLLDYNLIRPSLLLRPLVSVFVVMVAGLVFKLTYWFVNRRYNAFCLMISKSGDLIARIFGWMSVFVLVYDFKWGSLYKRGVHHYDVYIGSLVIGVSLFISLSVLWLKIVSTNLDKPFYRRIDIKDWYRALYNICAVWFLVGYPYFTMGYNMGILLLLLPSLVLILFAIKHHNDRFALDDSK